MHIILALVRYLIVNDDDSDNNNNNFIITMTKHRKHKINQNYYLLKSIFLLYSSYENILTKIK
jgi:hypothetical protein